ncbi:MAG: DUF805 domain-containing protein [Thermoguttaceae bacterium]|nr:DUF805 domain-containing protein [Thermoguttaceae bacterium]
MIKYIVQCLTTKYCDFDGRASLAEFFSFWFFFAFVFFMFGILMGIIKNESVNLVLAGILMSIILILLFPAWAVTVRRLHDGDVSGWWLLMIFTGYYIPVLILLIIFGWHERNCLVDNKYGPALPENTGKWNEDEDDEDEKSNFIKI